MFVTVFTEDSSVLCEAGQSRQTKLPHMLKVEMWGGNTVGENFFFLRSTPSIQKALRKNNQIKHKKDKWEANSMYLSTTRKNATSACFGNIEHNREREREEEEHIKQQTNTSWFLLSMTT